MTSAIVILFVTQLILPVVLIVGLWKGNAAGKLPSKASWLAGVLGSGAFVFYFLLVGRWDWVSYYLRAALLVALLLALYASFRKTFGGDEKVLWWRKLGSPNGRHSLVANAALALFFGALIAVAAQGLGYGDRRVAELSFPLEGGVYYVAQGGDSPLLNYHNANRAQRFALDVVKLNPAGTRAAGIYPSDPSRYAVFGEEIRSPCEGEVIEAVDGHPDLRPPQSDGERPAGNHVVVHCAEEEVLGPGGQLRQHLRAPPPRPRGEVRLGADHAGRGGADAVRRQVPGAQRPVLSMMEPAGAPEQSGRRRAPGAPRP